MESQLRKEMELLKKHDREMEAKRRKRKQDFERQTAIDKLKK
jgi:hypothetical protein